MKRKFTFIGIILSLTLLFASCTDQNDGNGSSNTTPTQDSLTGYSYSNGLDEDGLWEGVTALDHVELFDYKGLPIESSIYTIADDQIEMQINSIIQSNVVSEQITDRPVADGDTVNIDYVGSIDGVEFEGGNTNGSGAEVTIGVTNYIDDFLEQLIGHMPGETFNVEVTFPDDYQQEDLQGKDAVFVTTINYVLVTTAPELTDAFVSEHYSDSNGWTTVAELEAGLLDSLQKSAITTYLQDELTTLATVKSTPDSMMTYQQNSMIQYYQSYAESFEMEFDEYLEAEIGVSSTEELFSAFADDLTEAVAYFLVLQAIAEDANLSVTEENLSEYFLKQTGSEDYSSFQEEYGMPYLKHVVLSDMVLQYIVEHAVLA